MIGTLPDLATAVSQVSRYSQDPGEAHWQAVKRILRYLQGTVSLGLVYHRGESKEDGMLLGYCDADLGGNVDDGKSTMGYAFLLGGGTVAWLSAKESIVALSTAESEYIAASECCRHAVWMLKWFDELVSDIGAEFLFLGHKDASGVARGDQRPLSVLCDAQSALSLITKSGNHRRTKHIQLKFHYVRERCEKGDVKFSYVETKNQAADILTKALTTTAHNECVRLLGMQLIIVE